MSVLSSFRMLVSIAANSPPKFTSTSVQSGCFIMTASTVVCDSVRQKKLKWKLNDVELLAGNIPSSLANDVRVTFTGRPAPASKWLVCLCCLISEPGSDGGGDVRVGLTNHELGTYCHPPLLFQSLAVPLESTSKHGTQHPSS
ncbi:hypothetical protein E1B28_013125 [Marasmius oreades]|uniref:Uncharacterized protein n=1 Tax=Marasmius oreades TaxID=181124 RepID=A0A9P7RPY6_9AGAR|nr:uncharacterized protein E1B28_013125 [Marasmius oreades]KAG7087145.1 hypothetical protein E1B28_013125 [Marasmius oreades]